MGYDLDLAKTLTPERFAAYKERLEVAFNEVTECDKVALEPRYAKAIACDVLKQVVDLDLFGEDSSTRALYGALDRFRGEEAPSPYGQAHADRLSDELRDVISTMSALIGTHTDSGNNDILALSDNGDLGRTMMRRAGNEVETYLSNLRPDTPVTMLSDLKAQLGEYDGSDMPLWHSTETLVRLEGDVREYARLSG